MLTVILILAVAVVVTGLVYFMSRSLSNTSGNAVGATLLPSGNSTAYETDFSLELALAAKGDMKGAIESFDEKIAARPLDATIRLKAAEVCLQAGKYERARELFREVQRIPDVAPRDDVTASYRLIDLYRGKLGEPGKSLPEFRRLIERYPDSQIEQNARTALTKLKSEMSFEDENTTTDRSDGVRDRI